jgi:arginine/lysine/ornithine decarboxylase
MNDLLSRLTAYAAEARRRFHMPGHKGNTALLGGDLPYALDITEITGFDDLHAPQGVLRDIEIRAAEQFGTARAYLSVNGSTACNLAAMYCHCKPGDTVLLMDNAHRSIHHALEILRLRPVWLPCAHIEKYDMRGSITAAQVEVALATHPETTLCVVTSPTYEGIHAPCVEIAAICHAHGAALHVDGAHGLTVPHCADTVSQSMHKNFPALTQTALLHVNNPKISDAAVRHAMDLFQSSSPSYLLMASVDRCLTILRTQAATLDRQLQARLDHFYATAEKWRRLRLVSLPNKDREKILLDVRACGVSGAAAMEILRAEGIEPEYARNHLVLLLAGLCSETEDFSALEKACAALDRYE